MKAKAYKAWALASLAFLHGCSNWGVGTPAAATSPRRPPSSSSYFDFSWELSGDRLAAPLQVFDDGYRMWLQFSPLQGEPSLWRPAPEGGRHKVEYSQQGPYLLLEAVWPELFIQARGGQASVKKLKVQLASTASEPESLEAPSTPVALAVPAATRKPFLTTQPVAVAESAVASLSPQEALASRDTPAAVEPASPESKMNFSVVRADGHMRRTLTRWAAQAGWVFQGEHWSVDVDIPIDGDAVFEMPFEQAVQALLAATELSDRPLQPCFYSNRVVRVVAFAQACDRTAPPGGRA